MPDINQFDDMKIKEILLSEKGYSEFISSLGNVTDEEKKIYLNKIEAFAIESIKILVDSTVAMSDEEKTTIVEYLDKFLLKSLKDNFISGNVIESLESFKGIQRMANKENRKIFSNLYPEKDITEVLQNEYVRYVAQIKNNTFNYTDIDRFNDVSKYLSSYTSKNNETLELGNTVDTYMRKHGRKSNLVDTCLEGIFEQKDFSKKDCEMIWKVYLEDNLSARKLKSRLIDKVKNGEIIFALPEESIREVILDKEAYDKYLLKISKTLPDKRGDFINKIDKYMEAELLQEAQSREKMSDTDKELLSSYFENYIEDALDRNLPEEELGVDLCKWFFWAARSGIDTEKKEFFAKRLDEVSQIVIEKAGVLGERLEKQQNTEMDIKKLDDFLYLLTLATSPCEESYIIFDKFMNIVNDSGGKKLSDQKSMTYFMGMLLKRQAGLSADPRQEGAIVKYLKGMLEESPQNIIDNNAIAQIYTMNKKGRLPDCLTEIVTEIIGEETKNIEIAQDEKEKFSKMLGNSMQQAEFDELAEFVKRLKIKEGTIPKEYCECLMRNMIDPKNESWVGASKYRGLKNRTIEDFTNNVLGEKCGRDYYCAIVRANELGSNIQITIGGELYEKSKCVRLNETEVQRFSCNNVNIANTIPHEIRHIMQAKDMKQDIFSYKMYVMIKEEILSGIDPEFYKTNYLYMRNEIDARIYAKQEQYKLLAGLGANVDRIIEACERESMQQILDREQKNYKIGEEKVIMGSKEKVNVLEYFDNLISKKPDLVNDNPQLQMEYNLDGSKKSIAEVLRSFDEKLAGTDSSKKDMLVDFYTGLTVKMQKGVPIGNEFIKVSDLELKNDVAKELQRKYLSKPSEGGPASAGTHGMSEQETLRFLERVDASVPHSERNNAIKVLLEMANENIIKDIPQHKTRGEQGLEI